MQNVTLEQLLEAGCHFGHKAERWHPKASEFIWQEKDGIHIIDLAKTKEGLDAALAFVENLGKNGELSFLLVPNAKHEGLSKKQQKKQQQPTLPNAGLVDL